MNLVLRLASVPPNRNPLSYFKHKDRSIEASSTDCDDLFKLVLSEIPELKKIIIDSTEEKNIGTLNDSIECFNFYHDFAEHVDLLLYLKLSYPDEFDSLFINELSA